MNQHRRSAEFSIASYNIHGCVGTDGKYDPERIADVIKQLNADIIGLQEVDSRSHPGAGDSRQLDFLAETIGIQAVAGPTILEQTGHYGNALMTRFSVRQVRRHDLSVPGREMRGALDVDLDADGIPFRTIVTHLGLKAKERRLQAHKILQILQESPLVTMALLGDFNEWNSSGRSAVRFLSDLLGKSSAVRTFPSRFPLFALDRIWVYPSDHLLQVETFHSTIARTASDHLPVRAVVRLPDKSEKSKQP